MTLQTTPISLPVHILPDEVLLRIFLYLDVKGSKMAMQVCKLWEKFAQDPKTTLGPYLPVKARFKKLFSLPRRYPNFKVEELEAEQLRSSSCCLLMKGDVRGDVYERGADRDEIKFSILQSGKWAEQWKRQLEVLGKVVIWDISTDLILVSTNPSDHTKLCVLNRNSDLILMIDVAKKNNMRNPQLLENKFLIYLSHIGLLKIWCVFTKRLWVFHLTKLLEDQKDLASHEAHVYSVSIVNDRLTIWLAKGPVSEIHPAKSFRCIVLA